VEECEAAHGKERLPKLEHDPEDPGEQAGFHEHDDAAPRALEQRPVSRWVRRNGSTSSHQIPTMKVSGNSHAIQLPAKRRGSGSIPTTKAP
jgi:hypothetical protein